METGGGNECLLAADGGDGLEGGLLEGPPEGGGGGGALLRLIELVDSECPLPTLATEVTVDDLTREVTFFLRGIGGSKPTKGPPCCRM